MECPRNTAPHADGSPLLTTISHILSTNSLLVSRANHLLTRKCHTRPRVWGAKWEKTQDISVFQLTGWYLEVLYQGGDNRLKRSGKKEETESRTRKPCQNVLETVKEHRRWREIVPFRTRAGKEATANDPWKGSMRERSTMEVPAGLEEEYYQINPDILQSLNNLRPPLNIYRFREPVSRIASY